VNIEVFCAPNCDRCESAVKSLKDTIRMIDASSVVWRKVNIVDEFDYAVELGLRATPAIVINGKLMFTGKPDQKTLVETIATMITSVNK